MFYKNLATFSDDGSEGLHRDSVMFHACCVGGGSWQAPPPVITPANQRERNSLQLWASLTPKQHR